MAGSIHVHKSTTETLPDEGLARTLDGDVRDFLLDHPVVLTLTVVVNPAIHGDTKVEVRTYHRNEEVPMAG